jgi:hypothetical protein
MYPKGLYDHDASMWRIRIHARTNGALLLKMMLANKRTEKEDTALKIPYRALTLKEALYLLTNHCDGYFDAGNELVVLTG